MSRQERQRGERGLRVQSILRDETADGWTEISCHPGYRWPDFSSVYHAEREAELATLTDPAVLHTIDECGRLRYPVRSTHLETFP